jgi:hypothetical protein
MDQINPFTNAPSKDQGQPAAGQVKPVPAPTPKTKSSFDIKIILKGLVFLIIGVVIAKLAFDSVIPMFKAQPKKETQVSKPASKPLGPKSIPSVGIKSKTTKAGKSKTPEPSLSETFAAAKKAAKPAPVQSSEAYTLNGIFLSETDNSSSAIINNKVVGIGETVDGATIQAITIDGVELSKDGQTIKLINR